MIKHFDNVLERHIEQEQSICSVSSLVLQTHQIKLQQKFFQLKGRVESYFSFPFDPKLKERFEVKIGSTYYKRVFRSDLLKHDNLFMVLQDRIVIHTIEKLRNPIISVMYARKLQTEIENKNKKLSVLKRKNPAKNLVYGMKKTKTKISWGAGSGGMPCKGDHHILESHAYRVGKGSIILVDNMFFYREKGKRDILVAVIKYDSLDDCQLVQYVGKANDDFYQKCFKKVDDILFFGEDSQTKQLIKSYLE